MASFVYDLWNKIIEILALTTLKAFTTQLDSI